MKAGRRRRTRAVPEFTCPTRFSERWRFLRKTPLGSLISGYSNSGTAVRSQIAVEEWVHPTLTVYPQPWMKRVYTALVLIPIVLVLVFLGPRWQWLFTLAVAAVAALAGWEYMGLTQRCGANPPRIAVLVALMALFAVDYQWPYLTPALFGLLCLGLLVYCTLFKGVEGILVDSAASIFCLLYTGFTLLALPTLREGVNGPSLVMFLLCVVWAGDVSAYYVGRAWGRHKMAPTLSPGKSWEGAVASMAGSVLIAVGLLGLATVLQKPWDSAVVAWIERVCPAA